MALALSIHWKYISRQRGFGENIPDPLASYPLTQPRTAMKNIATNQEQSRRLLACGIDPETADMMLTPHNTLSTEPYKSALSDRGYSPAWSLSALLELLPKSLDDFPFTKWYAPFQDDWEISDKDDEGYLNGEVKLYFSYGKWAIDYDWDGFMGRLPQSENSIEAVVLAIELLHSNGYDFHTPAATCKDE